MDVAFRSWLGNGNLGGRGGRSGRQWHAGGHGVDHGSSNALADDDLSLYQVAEVELDRAAGDAWECRQDLVLQDSRAFAMREQRFRAVWFWRVAREICEETGTSWMNRRMECPRRRSWMRPRSFMMLRWCSRAPLEVPVRRPSSLIDSPGSWLRRGPQTPPETPPEAPAAPETPMVATEAPQPSQQLAQPTGYPSDW